MIFEEKRVTLKDGRIAVFKSPCVEDAEKMLNYIITSCEETDFLARYPEEWNLTVEQEEGWVNRLRSSPDTWGIDLCRNKEKVDREGGRYDSMPALFFMGDVQHAILSVL